MVQRIQLVERVVRSMDRQVGNSHLHPVAVPLFVVAAVDVDVDAVLVDDVCLAHRKRSHRYPLSWRAWNVAVAVGH